MAFVYLFCGRNMNDAISTGKMPGENTRRLRVFSGNFPVKMASFMFLSQHRDTQAIFYLLKRLSLYAVARF